jgi:hypothetical protein
MGATHFSGPLVVGPRKASGPNGNINVGDTVLCQQATVAYTASTATAVPINLPKNAQVIEVALSGILTGTSPTFSIGTTSANANELVNAQSFTTATQTYVAAPTAGSYFVGTGGNPGCTKLAADTQLYAKVGGSGLSAGSVTVFVQYIMPSGYNSSGVTSTTVASPNYPNGTI